MGDARRGWIGLSIGKRSDHRAFPAMMDERMSTTDVAPRDVLLVLK
jgi:hypothetical protein